MVEKQRFHSTEKSLRDKQKQLLIGSGYDPQYLSYFGQGVCHLVYRYSPPDTDKSILIKFRKESTFGLANNAEDEQKNISLIERYFPTFYTTTTIVQPSQDAYFMTMEQVRGRALTTQDVRRSQRKRTDLLTPQLDLLFLNNAKLMEEQGMCFEAVGSDGIKDSMRFLIDRTTPVRLANVFIEESTSKLRIIDNDLIDLKSSTPWSNVKARLSLEIVAPIIQTHFNYDVKTGLLSEGYIG